MWYEAPVTHRASNGAERRKQFLELFTEAKAAGIDHLAPKHIKAGMMEKFGIEIKSNSHFSYYIKELMIRGEITRSGHGFYRLSSKT
jgi:hypothetical protein